MNDNRNYIFSSHSTANRDEYSRIAGWIPKGRKVIDLGCGDGSLLAMLKNKGVVGEGIEISPSGVAATKKKGIKAHVGRIDVKLPYKDKQFDFAVCNVTIQMAMYPELLLNEMNRIAKHQIVSFPNFAFLPNRFDLLIRGRMPQFMIPSYKWYSTGHIHQLSINDFYDLCKEMHLNVIDHNHIYPNVFHIFSVIVPNALLKRFPNAFASTALFLTGESV